MTKTKVMLAEQSCIITEGLIKILSGDKTFEIFVPMQDLDYLDSRIAATKPDILLLNPSLLPLQKRPAVSAIIQDNPHMAVVALVYQYFEISTLNLFHAVLDIREERGRIGEILIQSLNVVSEQLLPQEENSYELSTRETDVLVLISKGLMNKEIADKLNISIHTVISHRKNIIRKTGIHSAAGLAVYAMMNNLIEDAG
ncbi:MAG: LuxR C-terminal-related transcriptional regulator [Tannerella sp.]|jgi:DNA-binding NarL/FixJ family response regulator|nr:LuxR C-terminal-related transcriptional regulator [Tannerella sp.]